MTNTTPSGTKSASPAARLLAARRLPPPHERTEIREKAGLTIPEIAVALDVETVTVKRWERGLSRPQLRHALAYGQLLEELDQRNLAAQK